jgi:hypothetical protein
MSWDFKKSPLQPDRILDEDWVRRGYQVFDASVTGPESHE